ncbi:MFS transporter [Paraburkholderia sp. LEh10]|uniref:MFS transporter n=1 Tax=Paraburkholderia sp. LEh10 TaxID=2821353 RepID=UPI0028AFC07F|nr:MFS transporter [Paraburkholderia sp. LEh10]
MNTSTLERVRADARPASSDVPTNDRAGARRAVAAAAIGNVLEWYDFAVYGFLATIIAHKFFPAKDDFTSMLATFAVFGAGFVMRPLGGIVLGRFADMRGRKAALLVTMFMMAGSTVAIGLVPTYASIGIAAPLLVMSARLLQGFSAGGEWGGATAFIVEWAPDGKRGLFGSFQQSSVALGMLLGSGVSALCSTALGPDAMDSWGWRVPFLLGCLLGPVGMYMRRNIAEAPTFSDAVVKSESLSVPAGLRLAFRAFGFAILWNVSYYIMLAYMPTFFQKFVGLDHASALWSNTAGLLVLVVAVPLVGKLSDRIGRKPLLLASCIAFIVLPYILLSWVLASRHIGVILTAQIVFAASIALFSGPGPAAIAEMFPTRSRSTWMSIGYSLAAVLFGGFAPFVSTMLIGITHSPLSPTAYLALSSVVSVAFVLTMRETAHDDLR